MKDYNALLWSEVGVNMLQISHNMDLGTKARECTRERRGTSNLPKDLKSVG